MINHSVIFSLSAASLALGRKDQAMKCGVYIEKTDWTKRSRAWLVSRRTWADSISWGRFNVLEMFYQSVVATALFYAVVCWGSSIGASGAEEDTERTVYHGSPSPPFLPHTEQTAEHLLQKWWSATIITLLSMPVYSSSMLTATLTPTSSSPSVRTSFTVISTPTANTHNPMITMQQHTQCESNPLKLVSHYSM